MCTYRVLLVDCNRLFRDVLKLMLEEHGCTVVGQAASLQIALNMLLEGQAADLIVFDFESDKDHRDVIERIRHVSPNAKLVVLTDEPSRAAVVKAMGWSVHSFLTKDMSAEALARSFELVMLDQQIFPTKFIVAAEETAATAAPLLAQSGLSARELEILRALVQGKSNKTIARDLSITEATVKAHVKALLRKVRASNRTQAAMWAMSQGLECTA
jgi:two-component system nitrate/nitrite response regulator NarL